jgi:hypothetical protein
MRRDQLMGQLNEVLCTFGKLGYAVKIDLIYSDQQPRGHRGHRSGWRPSKGDRRRHESAELRTALRQS